MQSSLRDIQAVLESNDANTTTQLDAASKLLMVAVALNDLGKPGTKSASLASKNFASLLKIVDCVLNRASTGAKLKELCLEMALSMTASLLKIGQPRDGRELLTSQGLMTRLIQTVFWFNSAKLRQYTKQIFDRLL